MSTAARSAGTTPAGPGASPKFHGRGAVVERLLGLAATPVFAVMALLSYMAEDDAFHLLCSHGQGGIMITGMAVMYALMSVLHLGPWLRLALDLRP